MYGLMSLCASCTDSRVRGGAFVEELIAIDCVLESPMQGVRASGGVEGKES